MRIDKWLWAARFYKTRALAQAAVVAGKVRVHGERVKPAKEVRVGDSLAIRIGEYEWQLMIREIDARRGPAATAFALYDESEDSRLRRMAQMAERRAQGSVKRERKGRPTKRERRQIIRFRARG